MAAAGADADASNPLSHTSPNMALGSSSSADAVPAPCDNDHFLCPNLLTRESVRIFVVSRGGPECRPSNFGAWWIGCCPLACHQTNVSRALIVIRERWGDAD